MAMLLGSRVGLLAAGLIGGYLLPPGTAVQRNFVWHHPVTPVLEMWARWDAEWYLYIAERGYDVSELPNEGWTRYPDAATGFLPLYPLLIRLVSPFLGAVLAGVVISNTALIVAVVLLYRLAEAEIGADRPTEAALFAVAALLAWPMSLFLSAVYAEALFLALILGCFVTLGNMRFGLAALLGAAAALCRPHGVLVAVSIAIEAGLAARRGQGRTMWWLAALGPVAALGGYALWCWARIGDPLAFAAHQARWRGTPSGPWKAFVRWWETEPVVHGSHGSVVELVLAILVLAALPIIVRRLRPSMSVFAILSVLAALGSSLWSFGRIMIGVFPIYLAVGCLAVSGRRPLVIALLWAGSSLGAVLMALYAAWWWAG